MPERKLEYYGSVKDGKITLPKRLRKEVIAAFEGKQIHVVFERKKKVRTDSQNAYYWAVVIPLIMEEFINLGHDFQMGNKEDLQVTHDYLKSRFIKGKLICDANGVELQMPPSTKSLSTVEFADYIDNVCRWAAEALNLVIPQPSEQLEFF